MLPPRPTVLPHVTTTERVTRVSVGPHKQISRTARGQDSVKTSVKCAITNKALTAAARCRGASKWGCCASRSKRTGDTGGSSSSSSGGGRPAAAAAAAARRQARSSDLLRPKSCRQRPPAARRRGGRRTWRASTAAHIIMSALDGVLLVGVPVWWPFEAFVSAFASVSKELPFWN